MFYIAVFEKEAGNQNIVTTCMYYKNQNHFIALPFYTNAENY